MQTTRILVWDLPVRVFHWLLAASFAAAFVTAEAERYRNAHIALGYTFLGLLAFRLLWAFAGTRYARVSSFAFGPAAVLGYLKSLLSGKPLHYVGHNPAGSWAIFALVALGSAVGISGYAVYADLGRHWLEEAHEALANAMLGIVIVHIVGVVVSSVMHRENLALSMITGYKRGPRGAAIRRTRWPAAIALVLAVALLWNAAPDTPLNSRHEAGTPREPHHSAARDARARDRHED
jgi:cytochrome b